MRKIIFFILLSSGTMLAQAQTLTLSIEIPRLDVAEYHRPYLAVWLENVDSGDSTNLAVWYDTKLKNREGEKWLKDMRQWWRRSGRGVGMPVDGVSGATRAPGSHQLTFSSDRGPLSDLPAGRYRLRVEAAREVGGRELLQMEFDWPASSAQHFSIKGERELTAIDVKIE